MKLFIALLLLPLTAFALGNPGLINDSSIAPNAKIQVYKLAPMGANSVVFTDPNGKIVSGYIQGDVVVNGSSTATIQPQVVTNSKLAAMNNSTIKCNVSGGSASPADCTGGQVGTVIGALIGPGPGATYGGTLVSTGSAWVNSTLAIPACVAISAANIDWSLGNCFTKTLSANTTFTTSNRVAGQTVVVRLTNPASYTWTMPNSNTQGGSVLWSGSTIPAASVNGKKDIVTIFFDGSEMFGNAVQNFGGF